MGSGPPYSRIALSKMMTSAKTLFPTRVSFGGAEGRSWEDMIQPIAVIVS